MLNPQREIELVPTELEQTLIGIARHSVLTDGGTLVYELRLKGGVEVSNEWKLVRDKIHGDTRVLMLKLNKGNVP